MKVYYLINENNEIYEDGFTKFNENCLEKDKEEYYIKNGYNGALFFEDYMQTDEYKEKERLWKEKVKLKNLRREREQECFSIINRGELWYARLTEKQKAELDEWYGLWLDLPNNYQSDIPIEEQLPIKPSWIK